MIHDLFGPRALHAFNPEREALPARVGLEEGNALDFFIDAGLALPPLDRNEAELAAH